MIVDNATTDAWQTIRLLLRNAPSLGPYFDRAEVGSNGVGRFIMGQRLKRIYPGDAVLCDQALGKETPQGPL